jgi:hypothetical protein
MLGHAGVGSGVRVLLGFVKKHQKKISVLDENFTVVLIVR